MNIQVDLLTIVIFVVAIVVVAAILRYAGRAKISMKGPGGTEMKFNGSNEKAPGAQIEGAKAGGNILAKTEMGDGAAIKHAEATGNIEAINSGPKQDPKA